jgi:hypothetical protein
LIEGLILSSRHRSRGCHCWGSKQDKNTVSVSSKNTFF